MDSEVELMIFDVVSRAADNDFVAVDCSRVRAEDEDHAREKFLSRYPDHEIIEIECRGSAF